MNSAQKKITAGVVVAILVMGLMLLRSYPLVDLAGYGIAALVIVAVWGGLLMVFGGRKSQ